MASTNDAIRNELETAYPDYDVFVEGVGQEITPFRVVLTNKEDGHEHEFSTTVSLVDFYARVASSVKDKHPKPKPEAEDKGEVAEPVSDDQLVLKEDE